MDGTSAPERASSQGSELPFDETEGNSTYLNSSDSDADRRYSEELAEGSRLAWFEAFKRKGKQYSIGEEVGNAISHGIGAGLAIAALVLLIVHAVRAGGGLALCAAIMFGVGLLLEYLFSTLYHAIQPPRAKAVLRVFDHSAIYVLIAGTYSPFCLVTLVNDGGIPLCIAMWAVAVIGIIAEIALRERQPKWLSSIIYLAMGWAVVFKLPVLLELLPVEGMWLLVAGGLSYSLGVVFYLLKRVPFAHMVWHLFVLGGSVCHFLAVILYVL